jgi:hypothetical protein
MAQLAGFELESRHADWVGAPSLSSTLSSFPWPEQQQMPDRIVLGLGLAKVG